MVTPRSSHVLFGLVGCCLVVLLAACSSSAGPPTTAAPTTAHLSQGTTLLTYRDHSARVVHLEWSSDGKRILSGSLDTTTQLWDAATGRRLLTYSNGVGASWSPDGTHLVTSTGNTVQVLDATTGHVLLTYHGHSATVWDAQWSPDGKRIASSSDDQTVQVWDAATGQTRLSYRGHTDGVRELAWSPDGKRIASGEAEPSQTWPETTMRIWDATTGRTLLTYQSERHYERVWHVAWSPDGKHLAAALDDGKVAILETATYQTVFTYREQQGQVDAVAWSPDGTRIASGGADGFVKVWQAVA